MLKRATDWLGDALSLGARRVYYATVIASGWMGF